MDVGNWTIILRSLAWLSSPRWLLPEASSPSDKKDGACASQGCGELADQMCAGSVIRSANLTKILYNFISGEGLLPFSLGDKQLVGPTIVSALADVLSCLKVWCNTALAGSQLGQQLRNSLYELFLHLNYIPSGPIVKGIGPLDAQICFVESLLKLDIQGMDVALSIRVVQAIVGLTQMYLSRRGGLVCLDGNSQLSEDDRICFNGLGIPDLNAPAQSSSRGRITPSSLLVLNLQLAIRLVSFGYEPSTVADAVLASSSIMEELFDCVNCCTASPFASTLGTATFNEAKFTLTQPTTVADYALQLLLNLFARTSNVRLFLHRLIDYVKQEVTAGTNSDISEPLLIFFLHVLKSQENVQLFHEIKGFKEVCKILSCTPMQLANSHNRLISNVLCYVSQTTAVSSSKPKLTSSRPKIFPPPYQTDSSSSMVPFSAAVRRSGFRVDEDEDYGLLNLAPMSTISCSHPSAQPADVLLQPNPPHRRARSPSWSHHFYPTEQFIELTITLPCPVLVREIQLHPHLASLATCPSAVGVEMSPESASQLHPVGAVLSTTGLTTVAFKLDCPQVAVLILLRLYKPRDSSNIWLAQIRILGSLALPTCGSDQQQPAAQPGLTWLCMMHHCLSVAERDNSCLLASLRETAGKVDGIVEQCCGLLNVQSSTPKAGVVTDVVQMASSILFHLGRHSTELSRRFMQLQLQESNHLLLGCTPAVANVLHELCSTDTSQDQVSSRMLLEWLHKTATNICLGHGASNYVSTSMVHCAAAVLWDSRDQGDLVSLDFAKSLFEWTKVIKSEELKMAVDYVLCSVCRLNPSIFKFLVASLKHSDSPPAPVPIIGDKLTMETLARAAQSQQSLHQLVQSGMFVTISQTIIDCCQTIMEKQAQKSSDLRSLTIVLDFLTLLCEEWGCGSTREVLATYLKPQLLQKILTALCTFTDCKVPSEIEDAVVDFFRQFCWAHKDNSRRFAEILIGVLQLIGSHGKLLTGFTRRLLLQLLLEPEKVYVYVTYPNGNMPSSPNLSAYLIPEPRHPTYKHGKKHKLLYISAETTCGELLRLLTDNVSQSMPTPKPPSKRTDRLTFLCEDKKGKITTAQQQFELEDQQRRLLVSQFSKTLYYLTVCADQSPIPANWSLSQALSYQRLRFHEKGALRILINMGQEAEQPALTRDSLPLTTLLEEFASLGGLAVLSQHLPMLLCASASPPLENSLTVKGSQFIHAVSAPGNSNQGNGMNGGLGGVTGETIDSWIKLDGGSEDLDEEMDEILMPPGYFPPPQYINKRAKTAPTAQTAYALPLHSLAAFSLFLSMPLYTEAVLQDRRRAQMLLRLALGVSDDGQGGNILNSSDAAQFSVLPFVLLQQVLDNHPLNTEKGRQLRQQAIDMGILQLLLACLAVFTQQVTSANVNIPALNIQFVIGVPASSNGSSPGGASTAKTEVVSNDNNHTAAVTSTSVTNGNNGTQNQQYWAKGTGFGTGSTAQTWDVDGAIQRQRQQEEQATSLLHTLAAYIYPSTGAQSAACTNGSTLPSKLLDIIQSSHLIPAICSYLRNDSVMDMARHVPLYKALLLLLRSMAKCSNLVSLLLPPASTEPSSAGDSQSMHTLLRKLKKYVSNYTARLASVQNRISTTCEETESEEGIVDLSRDICCTWEMIQDVVLNLLGKDEVDGNEEKQQNSSGLLALSEKLSSAEIIETLSSEKLYCDVMGSLQFDSYELLVESADNGVGIRFTVAYHFENAVRSAGDRCHPNRMKRLAQEAATLMTSLPLSNSSSVFTRCDTDRLDIMKVLITGPSDTPYGNGCFEFDVYFPPDYPQSPMQVHLATTGRHTVRFNPNLYNDGKVCLSVLNTWHGRPEEKWNPHTSSLLQVLVSIQSLILVSDPYFNEPGYERSRGTPSGNQNSRDYDVNIRQATVKWAMLEQIRNPTPCFKEVVQTHFWLKRQEIERQVENWISEMEGQVESDPSGSRAVAVSLAALKRYYGQLKEEMSRLSVPSSLLNASRLEATKTEVADLSTFKTSSPLREDHCNVHSKLDDIASVSNDFNAVHAAAELESLKEMILSNVDSTVPLPWPEDCEDSEAELDNFDITINNLID